MNFYNSLIKKNCFELAYGLSHFDYAIANEVRLLDEFSHIKHESTRHDLNALNDFPFSVCVCVCVLMRFYSFDSKFIYLLSAMNHSVNIVEMSVGFFMKNCSLIASVYRMVFLNWFENMSFKIGLIEKIVYGLANFIGYI